MEFDMSTEMRLIILGLASLASFGCWFNLFVARMERNGTDRGFTAFLVVAGVSVTGGVYALMVWDIREILLLLLCFGASGIPMIVGSVHRFNQERRKREERKRREAEDVLDE
jgi:hypothetical protein